MVLIFFGALYGVYSFLRISALLKQSHGLVSRAMPFERKDVPSGAPRALFVGDSTAVGVGAIENSRSVAGLFARDYPKFFIENNAVSGRKVADILPAFQSYEDHSFDLVIIQIGGNDIVRFSEKAKLGKDIRSVMKESRRVGKNVVLLTAGNVANAPLLPRPVAFLWEKRTLAVREMFRSASRESGAYYVDLFRDKSDDPFAADPKRYHSLDLFHPSADGYALWYASLKETIEGNHLVP